MRIACALLLTLAAGGCGDLFDADNVPEGYACSPQNTCPPRQQCVPGEHVCRTPCTQTSLATMNMGSTPNGQCQNINSGGSGAGYSCDYDHFCRPRCNGGLSGTCGGCSDGEVCDTSVSICRPQCADGCAMNWGCIDVSGMTNGNSTPMVCAGCRPLAASTFLPPKFAPTVFYDSDVTPGTRFVAVADLAGDGHPSVIAIRGDQRIHVYANDGVGGLMPPVVVDATTGANVGISDVAVTDLDHDGHADVVLADAAVNNSTLSFLPGRGDGTFGPLVVGPPLPGGVLAVGDFDGDGRADVAMAAANVVSIMTGDGMGGLKQLGAATGPNGAGYVRVGAYDFNGDGKLDLWVDDTHGGIGTFWSNGSGASLAFSAGPSLSGGTRTDEALVDVDGDGKDDFAVAGSSPTGPMGSVVASVTVTKNSGGGNFGGSSTSVVLLPAAGRLVVADFDGDGHRDLALLEASSTGKSAIDFLSGDGTKLIYSEQIALGKDFPDAIATGDLDGDGRPDLVIGLSSGGVAVLLNQTATKPPM